MRDGESFDYRDYSLRTAHAAAWKGTVFVSLSGDPVEPLAQRMSAFEGVATKFDPAGTRFARGQGDLGQGQALRPGMVTMSRDGSLISQKLLGACTADDHGIDGGIMILPNPLYAGFYVDHFWTIAFYAISPGATEVVYSWFVHRHAAEGDDFELEKLIDVGRTTQIEDDELIERTQSGVESRHFVPGPVASAVEPALTEFKANYLKHMG